MNPTTEVDDPYCLRPGVAGSMLADAPWRRLLVIGDSTAVHPGDPLDGYVHRTWADRLASHLRLHDYVNLGVSGATAAQVHAGQLDRGLAFRPDLAFVLAGANDARRRSFTPAIERELEQIIGPLSRAGALVVTFGCFDVGRTARLPAELRAALSARLRTLSRVTAGVCWRHGGIHVDFADHPAQASGVLGADLLHVNARGHAVVEAAVVRALTGSLRGAPSARLSAS